MGLVSNPYRERTKPWYGTARWQKLRKAQLSREPLCAYCLKQEVIEAATVCDHTEPHKGDEDKFWTGPFQSLCKRCHDSTKQSEERTGRKRQVYGADGWPI